jgi:hypothetical protein
MFDGEHAQRVFISAQLASPSLFPIQVFSPSPLLFGCNEMCIFVKQLMERGLARLEKKRGEGALHIGCILESALHFQFTAKKNEQM